jgi:hypothetical protein
MKVYEALDAQGRVSGRRAFIAAAGILVVFGTLRQLNVLDPIFFFPGLLAALCGLLAIAFRGIRCPRCSSNLAMFPRGGNTGAIKFCPYCAVSMDDEAVAQRGPPRDTPTVTPPVVD